MNNNDINNELKNNDFTDDERENINLPIPEDQPIPLSSTNEENTLKKKNTQKLYFKIALFFILTLSIILGRKQIEELTKKIVEKVSPISAVKNNNYAKKTIYEYVKTTQELKVKNKEQIKNIYFTFINSGMDKINIKCDPLYKNCLDDIDKFSKDQFEMSYLNGFVHPFNSFKNIETAYDSLGRISIINHKAYTKEEIEKITKIVKQLDEKLIKGKTEDAKEIIRIIHDYIIDNTRYDKDMSDNNIENYKSNSAYGPLIEGYGLCTGYADAMSLFLNYYNIPNYKIINKKHVWNAVKLKDKWYHLDLTWDDPVVVNGIDKLEHTFFLIDNLQLEKLDDKEHNFDINIFSEFKTKDENEKKDE